MGGTRADGSRYVTGELIAGGSGASLHKDGVDAIETDATNCMNLPAESLEMDAPVRVLRTALREDSGGAGRVFWNSRGGLRCAGRRKRLRQEHHLYGADRSAADESGAAHGVGPL